MITSLLLGANFMTLFVDCENLINITQCPPQFGSHITVNYSYKTESTNAPLSQVNVDVWRNSV